MIKLAIIDKEVNTNNKKIHTIKSEGILQTINSQQSNLKISDYDNLTLIINLNLTGQHSAEILELIKRNKAKICLLLSNDDRENYSNDYVLTTANWLIYNNTNNNSLSHELNQAINQGKTINSRVTKRILNYISKQELIKRDKPVFFSKREIQIMQIISKGKPNRVAALELGLSLQTVKNHLKRVFNKLNVTTRNDAINVFNKINF